MNNGTLRKLLAVGLGIACIGTAAAFGPAKQRYAKVGETVPKFSLEDSTGKKHMLTEYEGHIIVLEWINPDCPFVKGVYANKSMQSTYETVKKTDPGVIWLAVNTTHYTDAKQNNGWIEEHDLVYPILLDTNGDVGRLYQARTTPHMYVIDTKGVLRYSGAIHDDPRGNKPAEEITNYVVNAVQQIKAGETVSPDQSKPWGCNVKFKK